MSVIIVIYTWGAIKWLFAGLIPFCLLQIVYYISCYAEKYLLPAKTWAIIWGWCLAFMLACGLGYVLYKLLKND